MKILFLSAICLMLALGSYAQKKVAVITFYINKELDITEFSGFAQDASMKLANDPSFNLSPILNNFHEQFFNNYAKAFPFQLLPESEVTGNESYKKFVPVGGEGVIINEHNYLIPYDGYKIVIPFLGHESERELLNIFNQCDGVLRVYISFKLDKVGFGGMGVVKVKAVVHMILINKDGNKVFSVEEDATSKKVSPMVGGIPIMTPEKILPMCESALASLMDEMPKALPKIIKKTDAKL